MVRDGSNGVTVGVCGQFLPTFQCNVVMWSKRLWDRVSQCPNYVLARFTISVLPVLSWLMKLVIGLPFALRKY